MTYEEFQNLLKSTKDQTNDLLKNMYTIDDSDLLDKTDDKDLQVAIECTEKCRHILDRIYSKSLLK